MKLHLDNAQGEFRITGYAGEAIVVNQIPHAGPLLVQVNAEPTPWHIERAGDIDDIALRTLIEMTPEVLLIGTGAQQRFPQASALRTLYDASVGFEIMDTAAACRTFNILAAEGRRVIAALLPRAH